MKVIYQTRRICEVEVFYRESGPGAAFLLPSSYPPAAVSSL
jgi:hypothetical protein